MGKKILSPTGEQLGYVTGAYLSRDLKTLAALAAADGDEEEFILPARAVKSVSDAVIATRQRVTAPNGVPAPIGMHAYSEEGADLGVVCDWLFGDGDPVFLLVKEGVRTGYAADSVVAEDHVVVYLSGERPAPKRHAKTALKRPQTENGGTVSETSPTQNASDAPASAAEELSAEEPATEEFAAEETAEKKAPSVVQVQAGGELGSRNLLGKRVARSVFDAQGGIVALAGDRITPEVLSRARRKGRLLALTVNTLTNVY